jgi:hypothetical protein
MAGLSLLDKVYFQIKPVSAELFNRPSARFESDCIGGYLNSRLLKQAAHSPPTHAASSGF